jgi:hypothetical protein
MSVDPRKRQKKFEHRDAKPKENRHGVVRAQTAELVERMTTAAKYPILHAWIYEDLWTEGLGTVLLSRELPNGLVAVAVFLVDRYCLGVKNALAGIVSRSAYQTRFVHDMRSAFPVRDVSPATVRKLVEQTVAYASGLGLHPHADHHKAKLLLGDIDPSECKEEFEFGKDGKPMFIAGPNDTPACCRQIMATLTNNCGPDGFGYFIPIAHP